MKKSVENRHERIIVANAVIRDNPSIQQPEVLVTATGAKTSPCPPLSQIPYSALYKIAQRFAKGESIYGRHNWRQGIGDKEYVIKRINNAIGHLLRLAEKVHDADRQVRTKPDYWDDDVAAIGWFVCFMSETKWQQERDRTGEFQKENGYGPAK